MATKTKRRVTGTPQQAKGEPTPRQLIFLRRLAEAEARLRKALAGLSPAALNAEPVVGAWTIKDLVGHIVSWNEELRTEIQAILEGQPPGYAPPISPAHDFDAWNQAQIALKRSWSWRRIRASLDRDYREAEALILRLRPGDFRRRGVPPWVPAPAENLATPTPADTKSVETVLTYHWRHIHAHTRQIEAWRQQRAHPPRRRPHAQ